MYQEEDVYLIAERLLRDLSSMMYLMPSIALSGADAVSFARVNRRQDAESRGRSSVQLEDLQRLVISLNTTVDF